MCVNVYVSKRERERETDGDKEKENTSEVTRSNKLEIKFALKSRYTETGCQIKFVALTFHFITSRIAGARLSTSIAASSGFLLP